MKKLNAVNTILPYLGEHVVTSLDSRSPTVALILAGLEQHSTSMFAEGYWFNTQETTVKPNSGGIIYTPDNMLAFYSIGRSVEPRGDRLWDIDNSTWYFTEDVRCRIIDKLDFERIPEYAALAVTYSVGIELYTADFGVDNTLQIMQTHLASNLTMLRQENLRKRHYSVLRPAHKRFQHHLWR